MAFYSELTKETIKTSFYDSEEQAHKTMTALYNGATFKEASKFCNGYEDLENKPFPAQNITSFRINGAIEFAIEVFKKEIQNDFESGSFNRNKEFSSDLVQMIYDDAVAELDKEGAFKVDEISKLKRLNAKLTEANFALVKKVADLTEECDKLKGIFKQLKDLTIYF